MTRPISFDLERTLDAAMHAFWKTGYAGTSIKDLLSAMRLGEGSFYNTFGSKKHVFLKCLKRYGAVVVQARVEALTSAPTIAAGLRAMYRLEFDGFDDPDRPSRLCMMVGMVAPDVLADPDLRKIVEAGQQRFEGLLVGLIKRDIALGLLPAGMDADAAASLVVLYGQGLNRMALISYDRPALERTTELFLNGLGFADEEATSHQPHAVTR